MSVRLGLKGEASARSAWHGVKKKLFSDAKPGDGEEVQASLPKPKTPRKPKAANGNTPSKSGKKSVKSEATVKDDDEDNIGDAGDAEVNNLQDGDAEAKGKGEDEAKASPIGLPVFDVFCLPILTQPS